MVEATIRLLAKAFEFFVHQNDGFGKAFEYVVDRFEPNVNMTPILVPAAIVCLPAAIVRVKAAVNLVEALLNRLEPPVESRKQLFVRHDLNVPRCRVKPHDSRSHTMPQVIAMSATLKTPLCSGPAER